MKEASDISSEYRTKGVAMREFTEGDEALERVRVLGAIVGDGGTVQAYVTPADPAVGYAGHYVTASELLAVPPADRLAELEAKVERLEERLQRHLH